MAPLSGARLFLPLLVEKHVHVVVRGEAAQLGPIELSLNDWTQSVAPSAEIRLDPPAGVLHPGTNELAFRCAGTAPCHLVSAVELVYEVKP